MSVLSAVRRARHGRLKGLDPVWRVLGAGYRRAVQRVGHRFPVTTMIGGYGPFRIHPHFAFMELDRWGGDHNAGFSACVEAARGASCVLDVGAHVGFVSLPLSGAVDPAGRVIAFEPATANARILRQHLEWNRCTNVEVVESLVGASSGEVEFHEMDEPTGMNSVMVKKAHARYRTTTRPQVTVDDVCAERNCHPELIKIDVEGAEIEVLGGATRVLAEDRPTLFLSVHPTQLELLGSSVAELVALLDHAGYAITEIDGSAPNAVVGGEYVVRPVRPAARR